RTTGRCRTSCCTGTSSTRCGCSSSCRCTSRRTGGRDAMSAQTRDLTSSRSAVLWFGVLGPPLAWASHLLLGDGLFELGCNPGFQRREIYGLPFEFWDYLQTALFLAIVVAAGV